MRAECHLPKPCRSVSEHLIRLSVRHSRMAEPWFRASPEGHSTAYAMAPSGIPAEVCKHRLLVHPAATMRHYRWVSAMSTPSTGALGATMKGRPAASSVPASAAIPLGRRWTPLTFWPLLRTSTPSIVWSYAKHIPLRQACRPAGTAGRRLAAWPRCMHQPAVLHPAVAAAGSVDLVLGLALGAHVLEVRPPVLPFLLSSSATSTMGIIPRRVLAPCLQHPLCLSVASALRCRYPEALISREPRSRPTQRPAAPALRASFHSSWTGLFMLLPCTGPVPSAPRRAIAFSPALFSTSPPSATAPSASVPWAFSPIP